VLRPLTRDIMINFKIHLRVASSLIPYSKITSYMLALSVVKKCAAA